MILRDVDIFKKLRHVDIGMTVTSTDDAISRYFEKLAPPASVRLQTLKKLNELGFKTYVFVGPLLPHFVAQPKSLETLFKEITSTGNKDIYVEHINLAHYILARLLKEMKNLDKATLTKFYQSKDQLYRKKLDVMILELVKKYHLHLRLSKPIYHRQKKKD